MKLVTWNCCRGAFEKKAPLLDGLQPDIAIFQEIAKPVCEDANTLWFGENPKIGMAIQARPPYQITPFPQMENVPNYVIPIAVTGPVNFLLFAVWTTDDKKLKYVRGLSTAMDIYADVLRDQIPTVFMGDFNSNALWDKLHPSHLNHTSMVERMERHGLVSAFHHHHTVAHGKEAEKTFYHHRKEEKPHHIDYCFVPKTWAGFIAQVKVGTFEEWKADSDHRPLLVEVCLS